MTNMNRILSVPPNIEAKINITARACQSVQLICQATGRPLPIITWTKVPSSRILANGSVFNLTGLKKTDGGLYQCTAVNTVGTSSKNITLITTGTCFCNGGKIGRARLPIFTVTDHLLNCIADDKITFIKHPSNMSVNEDDQVDLMCGISDSSLEIFWQKDGLLVANSSRVRILANGSLRIQEVQCNDTGSYQCYFVNNMTYHDDGSYTCNSTNVTSNVAVLNVTCHGE